MSLRLPLLAALVLVPALCAQEPEARTAQAQVLAAEKAWAAALVAGDLATLDRVMEAGLTYGHSNGDFDTKASYLEKLRSGSLKYTRFEYDEGAVAHVITGTGGNAAVVNASAHIESVNAGQASSPHLRLLHIWARRDGKWVLVAHQSVRLPN